ncbi:TNFAIP3-interacting protein 1-like [Archocentrus centrarchus]|uniref:TNFAIP3-interacting protein 1-like n=1 Tax=Archocentrus centrarchus TaxID=63155 RepID=UPI0011E9EC57|nr:TNFAIP3-interacting protein 1-like [Archocentrus centrarchus]
MSLHENSVDRLLVESQSSETDKHKKAHRLYPSLPNADRYEFWWPGFNTGEEPHPSAKLENTQSEGSSHKSDVNMKKQILILEEQKNELLSINEKWAKEYRTMVHYYKEKVEELKALQQCNHFEEEKRKHVTLNQLKLKVIKVEESTQMAADDASSKSLKAEKDVKELRAQNSALTRKGQHQREEIRRLNKALEEALQASQPLGVDSEELDMWKHQAEVYKEDFLKERRDREKLKEKYLELEKKYIKVHNQLHIRRSEKTWTQQLHPVLNCACANQAKYPHSDGRPVNQHQQRQYTLDKKQ